MRVVQGITLKPAANAYSVNSREPYVVYNKMTMTLVETQPTADRAAHAAEVLNDHAAKFPNATNCYTWAYAPES